MNMKLNESEILERLSYIEQEEILGGEWLPIEQGSCHTDCGSNLYCGVIDVCVCMQDSTCTQEVCGCLLAGCGCKVPQDSCPILA